MSGDLTIWKAARLAALTAADGWMNLTDRVPIAPGSQSVGRASGNTVVISAGPAHLGVLTYADKGGVFQLPGGAVMPFVAGPDAPPQMIIAGLLLELHDDGHETALRVRDLSLSRRVHLGYFPADPAWIICAEWRAVPEPRHLTIAQKGGGAISVELTHSALFRHAGHAIALLATHRKAGKPMFVIRDATSGKETYAASRFLFGEDIAGDQITLDFNRAFNPPCAFTDFAICPLPPRSNILPFAVRAGETWP